MAERGRRMAPFMAQRKEADAQRLKERLQEMSETLPTYTSPAVFETDENINKYLQDIGERPLQPGEGTQIRMLMPQKGLFGTQDKFAGGGIAKLAGDRSGRPPERGPNSQGLLSLMKRGMKI